METIQSSSFQSLSQEFAAKLQQLTKELAIEKIFFHAATTNNPGHLIIISASTKNVEVIEARKWLRLAFKEHSVLLHVLGSQQMRYGYKNGNPFIPGFCIASAKVYQNTDYKFRPSTTWKCFKKRFKKFERDYFYEHDVLMTINNDFYRLEARTSVFLTYSSLYEHHLTYLEKLYIGHSFNSKTLSQRIKYLTQYLPSMEGLFVKQNGETYYLIAQLEKAKQAAEEADEIYINWELYTAISEVENQLHNMVVDRFLALKKRIKSNKPIDTTLVALPETLAVDQYLSVIVSLINKIKQPEEIYLFHKVQTSAIVHYYLLLIGEGIGTAILNRMQQSVTTRFNGAISVALIGHSRFWIQDNLFIHQGFFKSIMTVENRVFKLADKQFTMHWEKPHKPMYGDLDYMYKATEKIIAQYFVLRHYAAPDNPEGLNNMFATAILRALRTFIFAKLSYQPHYLSTYNLWMLCVYAQPNLEKTAYLFERLSGDAFFKEVDNHSKFHHWPSRLAEDKGVIMDEVLNVLAEELKISYENAKESSQD
ncbi:MAG: hypothetical protein JJE55_02605 [Flavobacteriaceae bacterium]|nr:hypothetical protein [Flavobacteriaceae bacterium]